MIIKIAFRNLLRNKRRSLIVLMSIIVGVVCVMLYDAFVNGMIGQMLDNALGAHVAHFQVHKQGYLKNKDISAYIPNQDKVEALLDTSSQVKNWTKRISTFGMVSSANNSAGIVVTGVDFESEALITDIHDNVIEGEYLSGNESDILISSKTAKKLEVEIGDKVVIMAADVEGNVASELFRVSGIYKTPNSEHDKMYIYIARNVAGKMLGLGDHYTELTAICDKAPDSELFKAGTNEYLASLGLAVDTYRDLLPLIVYYVEMANSMMYWFYLIFGIGVVFGVINTMLMSVYERINEIGVLMSIGMGRLSIFGMIVKEAFVLGVIGTIIGFIIGFSIYFFVIPDGINLSWFSEGLNAYGMDSVIELEITISVVLNSLLIMPFITAMGAIYPAFKAIRLQPTEAMRHI